MIFIVEGLEENRVMSQDSVEICNRRFTFKKVSYSNFFFFVDNQLKMYIFQFK